MAIDLVRGELAMQLGEQVVPLCRFASGDDPRRPGELDRVGVVVRVALDLG